MSPLEEIDVGDDLFPTGRLRTVVRDRDGKLHRIQVKTATAEGFVVVSLMMFP
jgi:hypothetical protein